MLGEYQFSFKIQSEKRNPWELFECQFRCDQPLNELVLYIESNYGGDNTCVYQFGVHGTVKQ